jgi:transposase
MPRKLPPLPPEVVDEIERAWTEKQSDWARSRLLVVRLLAFHKHEAEEIAKIAGVSRKTVFNYRDAVLAGGVSQLLTRKHAGGRSATVRGEVAAEFIVDLSEGHIRRAKDAQAWIQKHTHRSLSVSGAWKVLRRLKAVQRRPVGSS